MLADWGDIKGAKRCYERALTLFQHAPGNHVTSINSVKKHLSLLTLKPNGNIKKSPPQKPITLSDPSENLKQEEKLAMFDKAPVLESNHPSLKFFQASVDLLCTLEATLPTLQNKPAVWNTYAAGTFTATTLRALRKNTYASLLSSPESYGIPHAVMNVIHPHLKQPSAVLLASASCHAALSRQIETQLVTRKPLASHQNHLNKPLKQNLCQFLRQFYQRLHQKSWNNAGAGFFKKKLPTTIGALRQKFIKAGMTQSFDIHHNNCEALFRQFYPLLMQASQKSSQSVQHQQYRKWGELARRFKQQMDQVQVMNRYHLSFAGLQSSSQIKPSVPANQNNQKHKPAIKPQFKSSNDDDDGHLLITGKQKQWSLHNHEQKQPAVEPHSPSENKLNISLSIHEMEGLFNGRNIKNKVPTKLNKENNNDSNALTLSLSLD